MQLFPILFYLVLERNMFAVQRTPPSLLTHLTME